MNDTNALRQAIRTALLAGDLPSCSPERTWGGRGSAEECKFCGDVIQPDDMELELEFGLHAGEHSGASYHVHVRCLSEWEEVRYGDWRTHLRPAAPGAATDLIEERSEGNLWRHELDTKSNGERG